MLMMFSVVWVGHYLIGDMFRLTEQLLQTNDGGEDERKFGQDEGFTDQQGEGFEGKSFQDANLHDTGSDEGTHVLVLTTAWKQMEERQLEGKSLEGLIEGL